MTTLRHFDRSDFFQQSRWEMQVGSGSMHQSMEINPEAFVGWQLEGVGQTNYGKSATKYRPTYGKRDLQPGILL